MFGCDYLGQSIWSKTANASKCGHGGLPIPECAGDELLSIAPICAMTKENLRVGDSQGTHAVPLHSVWPQASCTLSGSNPGDNL
jgi:hypothetical protein